MENTNKDFFLKESPDLICSKTGTKFYLKTREKQNLKSYSLQSKIYVQLLNQLTTKSKKNV